MRTDELKAAADLVGRCNRLDEDVPDGTQSHSLSVVVSTARLLVRLPVMAGLSLRQRR